MWLPECGCHIRLVPPTRLLKPQPASHGSFLFASSLDVLVVFLVSILLRCLLVSGFAALIVCLLLSFRLVRPWLNKVPTPHPAENPSLPLFLPPSLPPSFLSCFRRSARCPCVWIFSQQPLFVCFCHSDRFLAHAECTGCGSLFFSLRSSLSPRRTEPARKVAKWWAISTRNSNSSPLIGLQLPGACAVLCFDARPLVFLYRPSPCQGCYTSSPHFSLLLCVGSPAGEAWSSLGPRSSRRMRSDHWALYLFIELSGSDALCGIVTNFSLHGVTVKRIPRSAPHPRRPRSLIVFFFFSIAVTLAVPRTNQQTMGSNCARTIDATHVPRTSQTGTSSAAPPGIPTASAEPPPPLRPCCPSQLVEEWTALEDVAHCLLNLTTLTAFRFAPGNGLYPRFCSVGLVVTSRRLVGLFQSRWKERQFFVWFCNWNGWKRRLVFSLSGCSLFQCGFSVGFVLLFVLFFGGFFFKYCFCCCFDFVVVVVVCCCCFICCYCCWCFYVVVFCDWLRPPLFAALCLSSQQLQGQSVEKTCWHKSSSTG